MSKSNQYLREYNKELKRLRQAVKRAEQKGYVVPENIIPPRPKNITAGSVRKLAKITPQKIREKSNKSQFEKTGVSLKTKENKQAIKKEQAKLITQTKKDKEQRKKIDKKAKESLKKLQENEEYRKVFSMGEIVYRKILDLCEKYSIDNPNGANLVRGLLQDEISQYGKKSVMYALSIIADEEILSAVEYCLHYHSNSPQSNTALYEISMLIEGSINSQTRDKMDKAIENDENWESIDESEWSDFFEQ